MRGDKSIFEDIFGKSIFNKTHGFEGLQKIRCPKCAEVFACRRDLYDVRRLKRESIWCPNGHALTLPMERK